MPGKDAKKRTVTKAKKARKTSKAKIFEECLNCKFLEIRGFRKKAIRDLSSIPLGAAGYCLHQKALQQVKGARNIICAPYSSKGETECPYGGPY